MPDATFGVGGKVTTDFTGQYDAANSVALQSNGKIVVGGYTVNDLQAPTIYDFALARFNTDGELDSGFGSGGRVTTDFSGGVDFASAVLLQRDGKIVAAGTTTRPNDLSNSEFGVVRYNGDPTFDLCIQDESNGNMLQLNTSTGDYQFSNCAGLTLGGTGILTKRGGLTTLQHNATDRRVTASIDTATNKATASVQLFSQGRTFTITDRKTTNNTCTCK